MPIVALPPYPVVCISSAAAGMPIYASEAPPSP